MSEPRFKLSRPEHSCCHVSSVIGLGPVPFDVFERITVAHNVERLNRKALETVTGEVSP